jgi:uncharacterized protein YdbL (DUF1318 family)
MKRFLVKTVVIFSFFLVIHSCVTINIYFPAAAVEKAADKIVEEVWGEDGEAGQDTQGEQDSPESFLYQIKMFVLSLVGPEEAYAQEADINVTTPTIRTLKSSIKQRADSIKPYLDGGNVGLGNDGLLVMRSAEGLSLKDKAGIARLMEAENRDREALYREIVKANNFSPDRVDDIKKIFAKSWVKQAKKGWWVQNPDGQWVKR